jgi:hypothetical protein
MWQPGITPPQRMTRTKVVIIAVALAIVLTGYEIAVRQVSPDAVSYDVRETTNGTVVFAKSGTITDPATVTKWRMAVTHQPSERFVWQLGGNCAPLTTYTGRYVFLWHGWPIETAASAPTCGDLYVVTRGGLPDPHLYLVAWLVQP